MPSWEVEFEFHIGGAQARGSGGGLAFWWAAEPAMPGTIYGHADTFNGVGIFLDTYEPAAPSLNIEPSAVGGNEPYLVAMVNDGSPIGGDLLRDANKLAAKQAAVCFARYRNLAHIARVRIAWASGTLRLWLDLEGSRVWQPCFETKVGDEKMSKMPTSGYFGLSASTGPMATQLSFNERREARPDLGRCRPRDAASCGAGRDAVRPGARGPCRSVGS